MPHPLLNQSPVGVGVGMEVGRTGVGVSVGSGVSVGVAVSVGVGVAVGMGVAVGGTGAGVSVGWMGVGVAAGAPHPTSRNIIKIANITC